MTPLFLPFSPPRSPARLARTALPAPPPAPLPPSSAHFRPGRRKRAPWRAEARPPPVRMRSAARGAMAGTAVVAGPAVPGRQPASRPAPARPHAPRPRPRRPRGAADPRQHGRGSGGVPPPWYQPRAGGTRPCRPGNGNQGLGFEGAAAT